MAVKPKGHAIPSLQGGVQPRATNRGGLTMDGKQPTPAKPMTMQAQRPLKAGPPNTGGGGKK